MLGCAEALGGILDHDDVVPGGDGVNRGVIGHLAEQADGDDRAGAWGDGGLDEGDIEIVALRLDVNEHRGGAHKADHFAGADPSKWHSDDFVAGPYAEGAERDFEAVSAAGDGDGVLDSGEASKY